MLVPALDHAFHVAHGEPLDAAVRAEIRRFVGALDLRAWDRVGLLPPRRTRLDVLEVPLPTGAGDRDGPRRIAERARRKRARATLLAVATPLSETARRAGLPPLSARDPELAELAALLDGQERIGVLLVGPEQAGKSALAHAYAASAPREVWSTSGAQLAAGMSGLGEWQERAREVMEAIAELDAVLYFESLDDALSSRAESGGIDLAGAMRPFLDGGRVRVCAEIRADLLDALEARHFGFFAALRRLAVRPLSAADTRTLLARRAAHEARRWPDRARVDPEALGPLVDLAERYLPYGSFPGKAARIYEDLLAAHEHDRSGADRASASPIAATIGKPELYRFFSLTTGVPEVLLREDAPLRIEDVAARLGAQVIGQEGAIRRLAETIGVVKAGLSPSGKPLATFLFVGPTGVGKTELARALAALLFGSADRLVRFDMSELSTPDAAERLIRGADGSDGLLTRRVREQPFSVLLLDEIEKAHPAVFDLLLQVTGEGRLSDARGRTAYFQNAIVIMTSNLGATERRTPAGFSSAPASDDAHYQRLVESHFRPELVGRIDRVVPFRSLTRAEVRQVARLGVEKLALRRGIAESGSERLVSEDALDRLASEGSSDTYGARAVRRHLDERLAAPIARLLAGLDGEAKDLILDVTLEGEPEPDRDGVLVASATAYGYRFTARRPRRAHKAAVDRDRGRIAGMRRVMDDQVDLPSIVDLRDRRDFLLTQLTLSDKEKADRRVAHDLAELGSEHHRLSELLARLEKPREEMHAIEELAVVALFEGQETGPLFIEAERAERAFRAALPYALAALEPRRDAVTLMIEELDLGALALWMRGLTREMARRGWSALAHVLDDRGDDWPADRRWGPPRSMDRIDEMIGRESESRRHLLLRVKGSYAGIFLSLEAGLCRINPARRPEGKSSGDEDGRLSVMVRTIARAFDVPEDAWKTKHLELPAISGAPARRREPVRRERDEITGEVSVLGEAVARPGPDACWVMLDTYALHHLMAFERGEQERDLWLAPEPGEE